MPESSKWRRFHRSAGQLRHVLNNRWCVAELTEEEADWARLLMERFYEIYNRRPTNDQ